MAPAQSQKIASWNELRPKVLTMKLTIFRKIFLIIICTSLIAIISVWLYDRYALRNIYSDFIKEQSYSYTRLITSTAQLNNENSLFPNEILIDTTALRSITLAHPVVNPLFETAVKTLLDLKDSEFRKILDEENGHAKIKGMLDNINVREHIDTLTKTISAAPKTKKDKMIKQ